MSFILVNGGTPRQQSFCAGVLVIVLCRDRVADLGFSAGERQVPLVVSSRVLRAYRLGAGG
jgi:hypothetical protein